MNIFFDSSTFAKRYVAERNSEKVDNLCAAASQVGISIICIPEVISALTRLKREKKLTSMQFHQGKQALLKDVQDVEICLLTPSIINQSLHIIEGNIVRAMDAIHVACALEWKTELFVSSDQRQLSAAKNAGLMVSEIL